MSASCPEDLEILLEDALLLGDGAAVTALFEERGVLVPGPGRVEGRAQAGRVLAEQHFVAGAHAVRVVRDVAVTVGPNTVNVSHRSRDGDWRLVAAVVLAGVRASEPAGS